MAAVITAKALGEAGGSFAALGTNSAPPDPDPLAPTKAIALPDKQSPVPTHVAMAVLVGAVAKTTSANLDLVE